jgi:hypothetical protein
VESVTKQTITPAASGAEIVLGQNQIFAITAIPVGTPGATTGANINLEFGPTGLGAASAADMGLPVNQVFTFDTSEQFKSIRIFNNCTTTNVDVYVLKLSRS